MFPCLPISGNIVAETKFASKEAKMFLNKFRNIFVAETMFPSLPTCFQMFPARETLFYRLGMLAQCFKTSLLRRGFCFLKNRGKEGRRKKGKGGNGERRKKRERKGKAKKASRSARFLSKYGARPGGWLCTAMPVCWAVEQRILKMAFLNFNNPNK